ncbi:unnamed protein product [Ectocarpus sp. 12 AP-2014]
MADYLLPLLYVEVMKPSPQQRETKSWAKQKCTGELTKISLKQAEHIMMSMHASKGEGRTRTEQESITPSRRRQNLRRSHISKVNQQLAAQAKNVRRSTHSYSATHVTQTWR